MAVNPEGMRRIALMALSLSTALNVGFLLWDPRMMQLDLLTGAALLSGGAAYMVAIPPVLRRRAWGFLLAVAVAIPSSVVVLADNASAFGSTPNEATFLLNFLFFGAQVPLVAACVFYLRLVKARPPPPPTGESSNTPARN